MEYVTLKHPATGRVIQVRPDRVQAFCRMGYVKQPTGDAPKGANPAKVVKKKAEPKQPTGDAPKEQEKDVETEE